MAKGGNDQRSNGSRFKKPHNSSNSFVTKVASRVSDYLGGWFGMPLKTSQTVEATESPRSSGDTTEKRLFDEVEPRRWTLLSQGVFDEDIGTVSSPAKRFKISDKEKLDIDFPISPIPSTSGLFQNAVNHTFEMPKREDFGMSVAGPSTLPGEKFTRINDVAPTTSSTIDVKANGAIDNHSDSSESTSGCSSLVPQSDRLSQTAYVCANRKRNLEEKLKYARQLQQSRASMYLNRSIPVSEAPGGRKKPSFDVTVYGSPTLDKSLLREKLINSPFYTGQTSYGGASAYRLSRNTFYSQRNQCITPERREGIQVQVKPSHHGSTEDLTNMSHTAKKILEALEQFSTPVNDAKRIPLSRNAPLGTKRRRFNELSETRLKLSTPVSPLNPNPGPVITGLNVPTVPDLLKLKRLERIQNSTAAAREVAVKKQEYTLPSEPEKHTGKIVTKLKNKEKDVPMEKLEEVNLPKIPLPITTLPKFDFQLPVFDFQLPALSKPVEEPEKKSKFVFSPPIPVSVNDAVAKLKRKSIKDESVKVTAVPPAPTELKTGSVMDFFKSAEKKDTAVKPITGTWECSNCLLRNLDDCKICVGCQDKKVEEKTKIETKIETPVGDPKPSPKKMEGFGDKFKPPPGTWSCKECFVRNSATDAKCIACETPNPTVTLSKKEPEAPKPMGFGDKFKLKEDEWECPDCMIRNKESNLKCIACEAAKPGTKAEKAEPKFKFGIDKSEAEGIKSSADSSTKTQSNGPQPTSDFSFGQVKTTDAAKPTFQFKSTIPPESGNSVEVSKPEPTAVPTPSPVLISPSFTTASTPNNAKTVFEAVSTSCGFVTGAGSQATESTGTLTSSLTFCTTGLNSQTIPTPSLRAVSQPEKPAESTFGASSFSATHFGSVSNIEPPKPFSFGSTSSFGTNPTPTPSLCSGFVQPNLTEKPAPFTFGTNPTQTPSLCSGFVQPNLTEKPAPFIFGASTPAITTASTGFVTTASAGFVTTASSGFVTTASTGFATTATTGFGAPSLGTPNPDSRPAFTFGQTPASNFNFGSNAPTTNFFGNFRQSKPENSVGGSGLPFGNPLTGGFGQSSAPTAFESTSPKFVFGSSGNQQEAAPVFKFGATAAQPASAPAGAGFSLSVPEKFNFTGGQIPAFSATPNADNSLAVHTNRKVIKAVRRTARDPMRRPQ